MPERIFALFADIPAERERVRRMFRDAGCSLCCGMNADRLQGREVCASSSNRNFRGRQGSPTGRTLLMSPVMVAAAAIAGEVTDARSFFAEGAVS